jgi:hypothetical protein
MKKTISLFALAALLVPLFAFADGGIVRFDPYSDRWDYADETNQQAFINYENGTEKMILSVGTGNLGEGKIMWIFPVPAEPDRVAVDVVKKLPLLQGEEISEKARMNLDDSKAWLQATQIYPIPFAFLGRKMLGASSMPQSTGHSNSLGASSKDSIRPDVVVYEHLEKEGITSEIVTARTAQGFNEYFSGKGLKIDSSSIPVLQNYIGKNYSFVVSWIGAQSSLSAPAMQKPEVPYPPGYGYDYGSRNSNIKQKGVFVSFPTDKIFFPLMPTSVYGSKVVPAEVRVVGHVTPEIFSDIKSFTKTEYYWDEGISLDRDLKVFYNGPVTDVKYTKIEINAPSKFFTEDLWAGNSAPAKTYYQLFFAKQIWFTILVLLAICSVLAGIAAGWLLFREWRNREGVKKFSLISFANFATILGIIAATLSAKTVKDTENVDSLIQSMKEKKYFWKRRVALGLIVADLPFLLLSVFAIPVSLMQFINDIYSPYGYYRDSGDFWAVVLSFLPVIVLVVAWLLARIKKEDQQLVSDLRSKNYSAWTFQPKDGRKIWFMILFTILFLIISWFAVQLLVLSVGGQMMGSGGSGF